ncbi:MAG: hypothetical protein JOZ33_18065 [Acidobacteriaceae bacterium]|nr:hypothetical protein [Acidobacteriaceae bacterium]
MVTKKRSSGAESAQDSGHNESESNRHHPATSVQPVEPDAKHTGGSPNRQRGAVRGNTEKGAGGQHPEQPAAQHATGSFTGAPREGVRTRKKSGQR